MSNIYVKIKTCKDRRFGNHNKFDASFMNYLLQWSYQTTFGRIYLYFKEYEKIKDATIHNTKILYWPIIFLQICVRKVNTIHRNNVENLLPYRNGI